MNNRLTLTQVKAIFGKPCDTTNLTIVHLPILGAKRVHVKAAHQFLGAYREIEEAGLAHLIVDSGIYNCRKKKVIRNGKIVEGKTQSTHSWAIAVDNNAPAYPYGKTRQQPKELREIFSKWGFEIVVKTDQHHLEVTRIVTIPVNGEIQPEGEDMGLRAYQSVKPERDAFADNLFTGVGNPLLKGKVFMSVRTDPKDSKANFHFYIIKRGGGIIRTPNGDKNVTVDHAPVVIELPPLLGNFSIHVESDYPVLVAVDQF